MTPAERQQSLTAARRACELLENYIDYAMRRLEEAPHRQFEYPANEDLSLINCLVDEFKRLDTKEQAQANAGREAGHLGAEFGNLPPAPGKQPRGRPRTKTKKRGKK
jgi:hypothetical protein